MLHGQIVYGVSPGCEVKSVVGRICWTAKSEVWDDSEGAREKDSEDSDDNEDKMNNNN